MDHEPLIRALVELAPGDTQTPEVDQVKVPDIDDMESPDTAAVLQAMFVEDAGRHLLDSGGAYGRAWEHNRLFPPWLKPEAWLDWQHSLSVTVNAYHWLLARLEYDQALDQLFQDFCREEGADWGWMECMEEFPAHLAKLQNSEATCFYGEPGAHTINTYNGECLLDHTLQFTLFDTDQGSYVILQVHLGCDVRGGYSRPRFFRNNDMYAELAILDYMRATISTEAGKYPSTDAEQLDLAGNAIPNPWQNVEDQTWYTDDGYHWYYDGCTGGTQLEDLEIVGLDDRTDFQSYLDRYPDYPDAAVFMYHREQFDPFGEPVIHTYDGKGYCPFTGQPLTVYP